MGQRQVGTLSEGNDLWQFEYDKAWAAAPDSHDLSPALPRDKASIEDGGSNRPVQWYFDNLLPEERLREAAAADAGIKDHDDAFALLEWLGAESAGSLTLLPPGKAPSAAGELRPLALADLSRRIDKLPRTTLASGAPKRISLAGAQHKLLVNHEGGKLYEPVAATVSTHILKPEHPESNQYPASVFNEDYTMKLADAAGLPDPAVELLYVPQPVYIIERFDRKQMAGGLAQRTHIIDACQLLNKSRVFKHTAATLDALNEVADRCTDHAFTRLRLFRWLAFNVLVGNDDCHLKNLSFHVTPESVTLAPHYVLLCTGAYWTKAVADEQARWPNVPMAFPLPGATTFGQITRPSLLEAAAVLKIPARTAQRYIDDMLRAARAALPVLADDLDRRQAKAPTEAAAFHAMQQRLLAIIRNIILADMSKALAA